MQTAQAEDHIPFQQLLVFGVGGVIPIALFNIAGQLMGLIGNISLGLSAFWLGTILIIPRLWDAVSDPIIGHLSDNTRTRWGRRRPYLLVGGIAVAISFVMMWWIPNGELIQEWFPSESAFQWFQLSYILFWLLIFFTACTIFEIPHGALGMEMTTNSHERTRLFSAKSFFGNLFAMATPWLFALAGLEIFKGTGGTEADGMKYVSIFVAAALIPTSIWWFIKIKEPINPIVLSQKKSNFWVDMRHTANNKSFLRLVVVIFTLAMGFNFVNLLSYYISIFYLYGGDKSAAGALLGVNGTIWAITGLLAVFPLNWISPKLGKRKTLMLAILLMSIAQLSKIYCYNPTYPYLVIIPTILLSIGMLFFFTLGASMVGDICDEDDLNTGMRSEGCYYSVYWWFIKMGTAFASFVTGLLIVFTQFDETQVIRVDNLQGNITQIHHKLESWTGYNLELEYLIKSDNNNEQSTINKKDRLLEEITKQLEETLEESKEFLLLLEKKSAHPVDSSNIDLVTLSQMSKKNIANIVRLETLILKLENLKQTKSIPDIRQFMQVLMPVTFYADFEQTDLSTLDLLSHLHTSSETNENSYAHYKNLIEIAELIKKELGSITSQFDSSSLTLSTIESTVSKAENAVSQLQLQAPASLLRMRIVEIGLPLLLCLISLWFARQYPLTDQRCKEIQAVIKKRNQQRLIEIEQST